MSIADSGRSRGAAALCALALIVFFSASASAQQTNNYVLRAVPSPGPVAIDGALDDWDLSGGIVLCYDLETLADTNSVRAYMMYDAKYLYAAFHFKDATPMVNHVNPRFQPGSGWRSDCVQMRIRFDHAHRPELVEGQTDRILHLDCYYFTDEKRPTCFITYGDLSKREAGIEGKVAEAIGNGVDAAFRADPDGKGYVQEMRIAWRLLRRDEKAYAAGQSFRCGLEVFWGDPTGERWPSHRFADLINKDNPQREFFWAANNAWGEVKLMEKGHLSPEAKVAELRPAEKLDILRYATPGPVPLEYALPEDGFVTLVIEKPDGARIRNLIADVPRRAGKNTDHWDGADDSGRLAPPGDYRFRGLWHKAFDCRYQFAYGTPANPPWETADGHGGWLPDHVPVMSMLADERHIYVAAHMSEGGSTLIGLDYDGQKQWGIGRIYGGTLARHGQYLYMLGGGNHPAYTRPGEIWLQRFDPETGKYAPFPDGRSEHVIASYPPDRAVKTREPDGVSVAQKLYDADWCQCENLGMAAAGNRLYVSLFYESKVLVIDPEKGEKIGEWPLERPAGLASDSTGALYAISGTQVFRLDPQGRPTPILSQGLEAPIGIALDGAGNIYVSDWRSAMCVKVFAPDGRLLRTIGRVGGRSLAGAYDPSGVFRPWGISVDAQGRLWVAEYDNTPRRISVWAMDGTLLREFCGPTWYAATECNINPRNPRQAFSMGNVLELDWEKGLWRVTGTLWRPTQPEALLGPRGEGNVLEVLRINGRDLLVASRSYGFVCVSELFKDHAKPLMALGHITAFLGEGRLPDIVVKHLWDDPKQTEAARKKYPELFNGVGLHRHRLIYQLAQESRNKPMRTQFIWTDANGDGLVQESEIQFFTEDEAKGVVLGGGWQFAHGPDLTLYPTASNRDGKTWVWRLPVKEWNKAGAPVYDLNDAKLIVCEKPLYFLNSAWADSRGNVLLNQNPMKMVSPDGKLLWSYPNEWPGVHGSHKAPKDQRGLLIGPLKVVGSAELGGVGEVFCMTGNMGKAFLMTTDGLYLGSLFRDCRSAPESLPAQPVRGASIAQTSPGGEWFGGEFFRSPADQKIYIGSAAREGVLVSEVTGLETAQRIEPRPVSFTSDQYATAEKLLAERAAAAEARQPAIVTRLDRKPAMNGAGQGFNWTNVVRWSFDPAHQAEAALGCDSENLYLCFRVKDDSPMVNSGRDWKTLFKTGDAVVFECGQGERMKSSNVPGDLRLLFSVMDNKPIAVLYRYVAPGTTQPVEFSSPVMTLKIDRVEVLNRARITIHRAEDGYTLEAAVPLSELGLRLEVGQSYRGDLGVIYSDKAGLKNELRMYWSNKATGIVSDLPSEARIQPEQWGILEVK